MWHILTKERDEWKASNDEWASRYNKQGEDISECRVELKALFDRNSLLERELSAALKENEELKKALELACFELWKLDPMDAPKEWSEPGYFRKLAIEKQAIEGREKG